ncbi:MAG TPA: M24 family metallopeptidase, partial [Acidimicrobiales bacterium]|nr:M24 family metallopeptidase [Acidimicrobiales bacterium]
VLGGTNAVAYATGLGLPGMDSGRAGLTRSMAIVARDDPVPHLFTPFPEAAPAEYPADHLHPALYPDIDGSALEQAVNDLVSSRGRVGADELTAHRSSWAGAPSGTAALAAAKLCKTPDELACIRAAQRINERAMEYVQPLIVPGVRQNELTAAFLRRIFSLGATANCIDPIWQPMPPSKADGPWTTNGDVAFPTPSTDLFLRDGDVVWVDTGIGFEGYASDFGRTWLVGHDARPNGRQVDQYRCWRAVVDAVLASTTPGATGRDLTRAAEAAVATERRAKPSRPWLKHFYLAHGVGTDSAEPPLIGTDLGDAFDESVVLAPGMVLVIEPVIWDEGAAGYRSEDIYAVTDDGWMPLSDFPMTPYGEEP